MNHCSICGNGQQNTLHIAREMMFGFRHKFRYLECAQCGCVQLLDVPKDLARYYPQNYYSFQAHGKLKTFLRHQWASYAYGSANPVGWLVSKFFFPYEPVMAVRRAGVAKTARILDVGCGAGLLIQDLWQLGFRNVSGADPYVEKDLYYPNGVTVYKKSLEEMQGPYDVIMLHHSFEHMDRPAETFKTLGRLLAPEGRIILRIPIAGSYAWKTYGVNWMHLDAPRHLFLHTPRSVEMMAAAAGLTVESTLYEGNESQFWGSEQYANDIPLTDPRSYAANKLRAAFGNKKIREYRARAQQLNEQKQGDLACFYLRRSLVKS